MNDFEILSSSRLTQLRFARVAASRLKVGKKDGGMLDCSSTFGMQQTAEPVKWVAKLALEIKGIPGDHEATEPAFTLELEVRGLYTLPKPLEVNAFENRPQLVAAMCQSLYVFGARKAESLLADMGVPGVRLDSDLRTMGDASSEKPDDATSLVVASPVKNSGKKA